MSSAERHLVSKILQVGSLADVIDAGITPKFFLDPDHRMAYQGILDHQAKYGKVPSPEAFKYDNQAYKITEAPDTVPYYLDRIRESYMDYMLETGVAEAYDLYMDESDTKGALARLSQMLQDINSDVSKTRVTDLTKTGEERLKRYRAYSKSSESLRGIPTGFNCLDLMTLGWQAGQLVTMVGPAKAGKSTMLQKSCIAAHKAVYTPMFIGFEMSNEEMEQRYDAMVSGVAHRKIRTGELSKEDFAAIRKSMLRNELMPPLTFSEDTNASLTVSGVMSQIDQYKPDVLFIDGVYMMEDDRGRDKGSPQAITNITRDLKMAAKNARIPIVITTQVIESKMSRTKGVTSTSIGYSSSFVQDSDVVVAAENTDDFFIKKVKALLGRNDPYKEWFLKWDWDNMLFHELEDPGEYDDDTPVTF